MAKKTTKKIDQEIAEVKQVLDETRDVETPKKVKREEVTKEAE